MPGRPKKSLACREGGPKSHFWPLFPYFPYFGPKLTPKTSCFRVSSAAAGSGSLLTPAKSLVSGPLCPRTHFGVAGRGSIFSSAPPTLWAGWVPRAQNRQKAQMGSFGLEGPPGGGRLEPAQGPARPFEAERRPVDLGLPPQAPPGRGLWGVGPGQTWVWGPKSTLPKMDKIWPKSRFPLFSCQIWKFRFSENWPPFSENLPAFASPGQICPKNAERLSVCRDRTRLRREKAFFGFSGRFSWVPPLAAGGPPAGPCLRCPFLDFRGSKNRFA